MITPDEEIEVITTFLDTHRDYSRIAPGGTEVWYRGINRLIKLGADFGNFSLRDAELSGIDYTNAKGLTLDNWLSAYAQCGTILPASVDFSGWKPKSGDGGLILHFNNFRHTKGFSVELAQYFESNCGMPEHTDYTPGWFKRREIRNWNFGYTTNIPLSEILQAKKLEYVYMPYGCDFRNMSKIPTTIRQCVFEDALFSESPGVFEQLAISETCLPQTNNYLFYTSLDKLLQNPLGILVKLLWKKEMCSLNLFILKKPKYLGKVGIEDKDISHWKRCAKRVTSGKMLRRGILKALNSGVLSDEAKAAATKLKILCM